MSGSDRLPAPGEGWRHYKAGNDSLYWIVGIARDAGGFLNVIYRRDSAMYVRLLGDFLQEVEAPNPSGNRFDKNVHVQRFTFEREAPPSEATPWRG